MADHAVGTAQPHVHAADGVVPVFIGEVTVKGVVEEAPKVAQERPGQGG